MLEAASWRAEPRPSWMHMTKLARFVGRRLGSVRRYFSSSMACGGRLLPSEVHILKEPEEVQQVVGISALRIGRVPPSLQVLQRGQYGRNALVVVVAQVETGVRAPRAPGPHDTHRDLHWNVCSIRSDSAAWIQGLGGFNRRASRRRGAPQSLVLELRVA